MAKKTVHKIGWIIKNKKRQSVWKQAYLSKREAEEEFKSQVAMIQRTRPTFTGGDWVLEPFEYTVYEDIIDPLKDFHTP